MDNIGFNNINEEYENYSRTNGNIRSSLLNRNIKIKKLSGDTCPKCNNKISKIDSYCKLCGYNLQEVYVNNSSFSKVSNWSFREVLTYLNMPKTFTTGLVSVLFLFLISLLLKVVVVNYIPDIADILNPIHIILGLNLGSLNIYSSTMMGWGGSEVKLGIIALYILPLAALTISNLIFIKKYTKDSDSAFRNSLGVGISYGVILFTLALLSKTRFSYSYNMSQYGYIVQFNFAAFSMLLKGILIGFLSTYMLIYKSEYEDENMYLGILKRAINIIIIGYITTLIILAILTFADKSYLYNLGISSYTENSNLWIKLSQLAAYMWAFGNFIPVNIVSKNLSLANIFNSNLYLTTILLLVAMIFLSALVIIVCACKLEAKYGRSKGLKPVILLSSFYAILMGILSIFTSVSLGGGLDILSLSNYSTSLTMGFSLLSSIVISFIYCFLVSLLGYKLNIFN